MHTGMFVIQDDQTLIELAAQRYDSEDFLQDLLEKYPSLLAGDQMNSTNPRRWLLISREVGVPTEDSGTARWALDHLFLDQDGVPTLIEVKRSTDTRIRREVVGQMLDYAANAVVYWPVEGLRATFEERCVAEQAEASQFLASLIGDDDVDAFWATVKTNLQAGKIRLVFVADVIPPELQRIVEFLNGQMDPAEVLAVEIKQYVGKGVRTLVPRVIGRTVAAVEKKQNTKSAPTQSWNEASFFAALAAHVSPAEVEAGRRIYAWLKNNAPTLSWGQGKEQGSVYPLLRDPLNRPHWLICMWTYGSVEIQFQYLVTDPAFAADERRIELLDRLNAVPGVNIPRTKIALRPSISLTTLQSEEALRRFIAVLDWAIALIKAEWS